MSNKVFKMANDRYATKPNLYLYQIWQSIFSNIGWTQCHTIMMHVDSENFNRCKTKIILQHM